MKEFYFDTNQETVIVYKGGTRENGSKYNLYNVEYDTDWPRGTEYLEGKYVKVSEGKYKRVEIY